MSESQKEPFFPFDKEGPLKELRGLFEKNVLFRDHSAKLVYFIRKCHLTFEDVKDFTVFVSVVPKVRKNLQVVSRTIQTVKSKHEEKNSEETDFKILDLSERIKRQQRRIQCNTSQDKILTENGQSGDDRSWWRTTWEETVNLYTRVVCEGRVIKDDDKDNYLPGKFLCSDSHCIFKTDVFDGIGFYSTLKLYSFFINRMCASVFLEVSKKQQLSSRTIEKLLWCVTDLDSLVSVLELPENFEEKIATAVQKDYWRIKNIKDPDIFHRFVKKIIDKTLEEYTESVLFLFSKTGVREKYYSKEEIKGIIRQEMHKVRQDAIEAIHNCVRRDKKVLDRWAVQQLQAYLEQPREDFPEFVSIIYNLIDVADSNDDTNYGETFKLYLDRLGSEPQDSVGVLLRFMHNQARDKERSKILFTEERMRKLLGLVNDDSWRLENKLKVLKMISSCLQHQHEALSDDNLAKVLDICYQSNDARLINSALTVVLLSTDISKSKVWDNQWRDGIIDKLMAKFELIKADMEECSSFIVFILSKFLCYSDASKPAWIVKPRLIELVSSKMLSNHLVELDQNGDEIVKIVTPEPGMAAYVKACVKMACDSSVLLNPLHLDNLCELYVPESMKLGEVDYEGEELSPTIKNKLLDKLLTEPCTGLKQELLSCLGSLIEANIVKSSDDLSRVNQILIQNIGSDNRNIHKLCMNAQRKLVKVCQTMDEGLLQKLVDIGTASTCNKSVRIEIEKLFESIDEKYNPVILQKQYKQKLQLANLNDSSPEGLLAELLKLNEIQNDGLLEQNYLQIKQVIDNGDVQLQEAALLLLGQIKCKENVADELLESVALLAESTVSQTLRESCLQLLDAVVDSGKTLSGRALQVRKAELNKGTDVQQTLLQGSLCKELKQEFELTDETLLELLLLVPASQRDSKIGSSADFLHLVISENSDYAVNKSFAMLVEKCLLQKKLLVITLPCYCRIIKEQMCCNVVECLKSLVQHFHENESHLPHLHPRLFEAMYHAQKLQQLPDDLLEVAMANLNCDNGNIRGYSFGILRFSAEDKWKKATTVSCDRMRVIFDELQVEIKESDLVDLIETIMFLKFFDIGVMLNAKTETWKRDLLISSIFRSFDVVQLEQMEFLGSWYIVEEKFQYDESCKILALIHNSDFKHFSQVLELVSILPQLKFDDVLHQLNIHSPEPFEALKQYWCISQIKEHSLQRGGITDKYAKVMAGKLCSNFCTLFIQELFSCLQSIDNLAAFESLVEFCAEKEKAIVISDIEGLRCDHVEDLLHRVQEKRLLKAVIFQPKNKIEEDKFQAIIRALRNAGLNFSQLLQLLTAYRPSGLYNKFYDLLDLLKLIHDNNLVSSSCIEKCLQLLKEAETFLDALRNLHKLAVENLFQLEGKERDLHELLAELKEKNKLVPFIEELAQENSLNIQQNIFKEQSEKLKWNENQINEWAKHIKTKKRTFSDYEAIAVILRANFLITGYTLTNTQMLCSLIALKGGEMPRGKLLQVATGEGKSTIISILAIIFALRGDKVDVITSSPVLAERDAKQQAKLYGMFGLTCSDNNDKTVYLKGRKDCYLSDIVYGEMSQFQFDVLRDNYSKLGTLGGRKLSVALVDEVDSMLVDDSSKIARLSSTVPGMDHFHALYVFIWQFLVSIKNQFIMCNNKLYFLEGKVEFENDKITLEFADENGDVKKIPDLGAYFALAGDQSIIGEAVEDVDKFLKDYLEHYLDDQIQQNQIYIPSNFADFVKKQKSKWIINAVEALNYQENVHYVVQNGEIKPVDFHSTGIVQDSTNWSDGLHQFLQLEHNLKMTSETLTTNFLSNVGLIKKYKMVCGLTGTLGSDNCRDFLASVYSVDLVNIPQKREKQFVQLDSIVAHNETSWLEEIRCNIMLESDKGRGILVVCETIANANLIHGILNEKLPPSLIKVYSMNNMNQEKNVEKVRRGQVIIATNLAGRGTDIQTDDIEATGGLHVILTFMPNNQRVEDQAFGRTSRQGKRGTGIMILNAQNLDGYSTNTTEWTTEAMKAQRDEIESQQIKTFQEKELKLIEVKDKLFDTFCLFLNEVRLKIRKKTNTFGRKVRSLFTDVQPTVYECCVLAAIEEQWAGFLSKLDDGVIKCDAAEEECNALIGQLSNDFKDKKLIKNPYYFIAIANDLLVESSKPEEALEVFEQAVELERKSQQKKHDEIHNNVAGDKRSHSKRLEANSEKDEIEMFSPGAAHVGIAWCLLLLKSANYKDKALASFKVALKCLANEMSLLNATQLLLEQKQQKHAGFVNSPLYQQLTTKATILGSYMSGVDAAINAIKRSKRMMDLVAVKRHTVTANEPCVLETRTHHHELERCEENKSQFKDEESLELRNGERYSLIFNHLTVRQDSGTIDQALKTIFFADKIAETKINLYKVDLEHDLFKSLNNNGMPDAILHVELQDLSHEVALEKLKSVKAELVHVGIILDKSDLLKLLELNKSLESGVLIVRQSQVHEKVNREELEARVRKLQTEHSLCYVRFEDLKTVQAQNIVENCCKDAQFVLSFCNISNFNDSELKEGQVDFSFDGLDWADAKLVIQRLRKEKLEFSLEFMELSDNGVRYILERAALEQEDMTITKVKNICDVFMQDFSPTYELNQFISRGLEHIVEINEKLFVPWCSVAAVAVLGLGQIALGGVLMATGFGISMGMSVLTEGLADAYFAFRAHQTRQFSWIDYCQQKAVSLALTAITMGYSKFKEGVKGLKTLAPGIGVKEAGTRIISNGKLASQTILTTGKNLKTVTAKIVCTKTVEAVAREGLNTVIQHLSNLTFALLKPKICEAVQSRVFSAFHRPELFSCLGKFFASDLCQFKTKINSLVGEILNPLRGFMRGLLDSVCLPLIKGVLSDSNRFGSLPSLVIRTFSTLNGVHKVQTLADDVLNELKEKLIVYDKNFLTISSILQKSLKISKKNADVFSKNLKKLEIIDQNDNFYIPHSDVHSSGRNAKARIDNLSDAWIKSPSKIVDELSGQLTDSTSLQADIQKGIVFIGELYEKIVAVDMDSFNTTIKSVSDQISEQLVRIMDSQILQPWTTMAVSGLTDAISKRLQHYVFVNKKDQSESQKADQKKYQKLLTKKNLSADEKAFMASYGPYRTFVQQLHYNARDYCTAHSLREMYYHASKDSTSSAPIDKNVQQLADDVRGEAPADLIEMAALASANNIKLKVVDDPQYKKTKEDIADGVEVMCVIKDPNGGIGHALYMDSCGSFKEAKTQGFDCVYGAVSEILERRGISKSVADLRAVVADRIESNPASFHKALAAETWIIKNNSNPASILFLAGLYQDKDGNLKLEEDDLKKLASHLVQPYSRNRGGNSAEKFKIRRCKGIDPKTGKPDVTEESRHHIVPWGKTWKALIEAYKNDPVELKSNLEKYINQPIIKEIFSTHFLDYNKRDGNGNVPMTKVRKDLTGERLASVICWHPNNNVWGPKSYKRHGEPRSGFDQELCDVQTRENQVNLRAAFRAIEEGKIGEFFEALGKLDTPFAEWHLNNGKYSARYSNPEFRENSNM
ncbi:uncharacterized protein LOC125177583 [Hyalella azteca]|uniref:Uncharacterized protein LOC125177583 n=1 Tax=Hyalella azteca TaxID=294128 RepID=A0A979FGV5_HYAAZ|nr:uncharacterized protein LOC125177583 [Hyalella azteca]